MSASRRLLAALATLAALLPALLARPAGAVDIQWREALWVHPDGAGRPIPTLLTLPGGWAPADAVAVLIPDDALPGRLRDQALEALLDAEAAVLELDAGAARAAVPDAAGVADAAAAEREALLAAVLKALRVEVGAGLVVVLGLGEAGDLALAAAAQAAAGELPYGPAAAAALGGSGPPRFLPGAEPPAAERWPLRAPLLCEVLAGLAGGEPARQGCDAALLAQPRPVVTARSGGR